VRAQIALARQAENAGPLGELSAAVEADPGNHQARFDYAQALHAAGQVEEAVESCWNCSAATASGTTGRPKRSFSRSSTR
jgi:thioredoxin-like negative regulator of GroEL